MASQPTARRPGLSLALRPDRLLALLSLAWLLVILAVPLDPLSVLVVTAGLLVGALLAGLGVLFLRKQVPVLLALAQLGLFAVVHAQLYALWGHSLYSCQAEPGPLDWAFFTGAHVLHAADVLDVLHEFGIKLQTIRSAAQAPGILLVLMHLAVDVFLMALVLRWGVALWRLATVRESTPTAGRWRWATDWERDRQREPIGCALFLWGVVFIISALAQGWRLIDWILWPADALLRAVDIGDAMQVFGWHLHGAAQNTWMALLAVVFRLLVGLYLVEWLSVTFAALRARLQTLDELCDDLAGPVVELRLAAVAALGRTGPPARAAIPSLLRACADREEAVRLGAAAALEQIDPVWPVSAEARSAVPALILQLMDQADAVRDGAGQVLEKVAPDWASGPLAQAALPALIAAVRDQYQARHAAAEVLGRIRPPALAAVPALIAALTDHDEKVQHAAATALDRIDSNWLQSQAAAEAVAIRLQVLAATECEPAERWEKTVAQYEAALALGRIDPDWTGRPAAQGAVPALILNLVVHNEAHRRVAGEALEKIDSHWHSLPVARAAVPALIQGLTNYDEGVRQAAAAALGRIDSNWLQSRAAEEAVAARLQMFAATECEPAARWEKTMAQLEAALALGRIDPDWTRRPPARAAVPGLIQALTTYVAGLHRAAIEALDRIDPTWPSSPAAQAIVPALLQLLNHRNLHDPTLLQTAVTALDRIDPTWPSSPAALAAVPALLQLRCGNDYWRWPPEAAAVLDRIDPNWRTRRRS